MKACVTGGGGYVGQRLGRALLDAGYDVVLLLDLSPPAEPLPPDGRLRFVQADVRDAAALQAVFHGAAVVFHAASYGMSGAQQLQRRLVEEVNVGGTQAVLSAAVAAAVPRLVYCSTYNVVYGGQRIDGGDETLPYFPPDRHPDAYSRTKALAEQAVLAANLTPLPCGARGPAGDGGPGNGSGSSRVRRASRARGAAGGPSNGALSSGQAAGWLRTCSLRPAGIYGPGELRHQPRIVQYLELGLYCFAIGRSHEAVADFVHVDNLVQACILAAEGLGPERAHVAAGQAYFINDDWPGRTTRVNSFAFYGQLVTGLGYRTPRLVLPVWAAYRLAWALEALHAVLLPVWDLSRLFILTRAEVLKAGGTHWFAADKARRELGYRPVRYSFQPVVDWFLERGHGAEQRRQMRRRRAALAPWWPAFALLLLLLAAATALVRWWEMARQWLRS